MNSFKIHFARNYIVPSEYNAIIVVVAYCTSVHTSTVHQSTNNPMGESIVNVYLQYSFVRVHPIDW